MNELNSAILRHRSPDRPSVFTLFDREWDLVPEVYAPIYASSTRLFTQWLQYPRDGSMLEIGCGAGVTAVMAALSGCRSVVAIDINTDLILPARSHEPPPKSPNPG